MRITALVAAIAAAMAGNAYAATTDIVAANNQASLSYVNTNVDYSETGNGRLGTKTGLLDTENGHVPGYGMTVSYMGNIVYKQDYIRFDYTHVNGHTNYVGSYQGGNYGDVHSSSGATIDDFSLRIGEGFNAGNSGMLTPYLELGTHRWDRGVNSGELYKHSYVGIGALAQFSPFQKAVFSLNGMVGHTYQASIDVAGSTAFRGTLGSSSITNFGAAFDYAFTKQLHGGLSVDYTKFSYGISPTYVSGGYYVWEPDSDTKYTTLRATIGYAF